jgi:calcium-dependent protein kinase
MIKKQYSNSQFTSEALILKLLDHPNLLKLYEIFEDKDNIYLVTE